jgi:hypothetical protein
MIHLTDSDLTLLYYGELSGADERDARTHLNECAACREQHDELLRLFAMVDGCPAPEPGAEFEAQVWRRLQPTLRVARMPRRAGFADRLRGWLVPSPTRWAVAGGVAVLVFIAFTAGRYFQPERQVAPVSQSAAGGVEPLDSLRERILLSALGDHFDRTQGMLVELASASPAASVDISHEQRRAEDLLAATRLYRRAADQAGDRNVANVLEALERVLVEVTLSPQHLSAYELESLQRRIENQELLFKLRVASSALRDREQTNRPAPARGSAGV